MYDRFCDFFERNEIRRLEEYIFSNQDSLVQTILDIRWGEAEGVDFWTNQYWYQVSDSLNPEEKKYKTSEYYLGHIFCLISILDEFGDKTITMPKSNHFFKDIIRTFYGVFIFSLEDFEDEQKSPIKKIEIQMLAAIKYEDNAFLSDLHKQLLMVKQHIVTNYDLGFKDYKTKEFFWGWLHCYYKLMRLMCLFY